MKIIERWKRFWNQTVAMAFDGERMWLVRGADGEVVSCPVVLSVAEFLPEGKTPTREQLTRERCMREGTVGEFDFAEAMVRRELRKGSSRWRLAPRVVVAAPRSEASKRALKDVIIRAGARDLITVPKAMAAALGAGVAVDADQTTTVLYLERDWTAFMVIRKAQILADWERAGGVDQLIEDVAAQMRGAQEAVPDFERLRENLGSRGLVEQAERAGAAQFLAGLRERCRHETERLPAADQRDWRRSPLYLLGPYAEVRGLRELVAESWACEVIVPVQPE